MLRNFGVGDGQVFGPIKAKFSPLMRSLGNFMTGEDWRGMTYTPINEMLELDDEALLGFRANLTKWEFGNSSVGLPNALSFIVNEVNSNLPIVGQSAFRLMAGEDSAFDFLADALGFHVKRQFDKPGAGGASRASMMMGAL